MSPLLPFGSRKRFLKTIDAVSSSLQSVDLLINMDPSYRYPDDLKRLRFELRNLKIFVVFARNSGNDSKIEDVVGKNAAKIHSFCLGLKDSAARGRFLSFPDSRYPARGFRKDNGSFWKQINEWYVTLLNSNLQSISLTTKQVLEIISSSLENLEEIGSSSLRDQIPLGAMEALGVQMAFLKSLIIFAIQRINVETIQDLLAHSKVVCTSAASLLLTIKFWMSDQIYSQQVHFKLSTLLQKITPVDPHIYETYTQALSRSKLMRTLPPPTDFDMDDETRISMKNLLDSLISILWDELRHNSGHVDFIKDQLQELYEGLRSLRTILKREPNHFDTKIKEDIVALVCDTGVFICSMYQAHGETNLGLLQDLLEAINLNLPDVGEKDPQVPMFNFPRTNPLGYFDLLLGELMELTNCEAETIAKKHAQTIQEELVSLRSFLWDIVELRHEQKQVQTLWDRVLEVAYRVECLIDCFAVADLPLFDSVIKDIRSIKLEIEVKRPEIKFKSQEIKESEITMAHSHMPVMTTEIVGFLDEAKSITNRLTRGSNQLRIVSIVGMAGQGKTTLATKLYKDPHVCGHFSVCAWTTVSQTMDRKKVLIDLLHQINPNKCSGITSTTTAHDVADHLRRSLKGKRYLIFLDDIWDNNAWNVLKESFPEDHKASRILLTSRRHDIAPHSMLDEEPHLLRPLNEEESQELLQRLMYDRHGQPPALGDIGRQVVVICEGLPLTILIVAGLLKSTEPEGWEKLMVGLSSSNVSIAEHCNTTLELSYRCLPEHLRPCLLYFAAFPEDEEVPVKRLVSLWIAEGFIQRTEMKRLKDVAEDYLKDLTGRSLIMVARQNSLGGAKAYRIHDLLHEFCLRKCKDENFLHFLQGGYDELSAFNEPRNLRRLCIYSRPKHFTESKVYCRRVRSMFFNYYYEDEMVRHVSFMTHICKLLRVLDLGKIYFSDGIPSEIGLLVRLAFLAFRGRVKKIPPWIGNLSNLETLILSLSYGETLSLPFSFWDLRKLKDLYILGCDFTIPIENVSNSSQLCGLDSISGLAIPHCGGMRLLELLERFRFIRKLKCKLFKFRYVVVNFIVEIVVPDILHQLESLHMLVDPWGVHSSTTFEFSLPKNLKKLTLSGKRGFRLSERGVSSIGKLPNLQVFKLIGVDFEWDTWRMDEEQCFSKLRFLKLSDLSLVSWSGADDDQFSCLEKLVLSDCNHLKEFPSCLENISTLEVIEVSYCSDAVEELVKKIAQVQLYYGNSDLKIIIKS